MENVQKLRSQRVNVRKITVTAMMGAMASVLMYIDFPIPSLIPNFIKMDFSELPALIASFSMGPVSGVMVCLIKNLVHLFKTTTGGVGELSNFVLGAAFVLPAGIFYRIKKTRKAAIISSSAGAVLMAVLSVFSNYYIVYPIYTNFMPMEVILDMYKEINPRVENLWDALIWFNMPFTFIKGMINVIVTVLIYKKISPIIKGKSK